MVLRPRFKKGLPAKAKSSKASTKERRSKLSSKVTSGGMKKKTKAKSGKEAKLKEETLGQSQEVASAEIQRGHIFPKKRTIAELKPAEFKSEDFRIFPKQFPIGPCTASPEEIQAYLQKYNLRVEGIPNLEPLFHFNAECFTEEMRTVLSNQNISKPTPIQAASIPVVLSGHDCIGLAETGSGKTLSYVLPCIVHINAQPRTKVGDGPTALVLCPTRELALQIHGQVEPFGQQKPRFRSVVFYGGTELTDDQLVLNYSFQVCVATPGRLTQYLRQTNLTLKRVTFLVLDEADRMLDMGFGGQIRSIGMQLRHDRQTVMWSATWPPGVQKLATEYLTKPVKVVANDVDRLSANKAVTQCFYFPTFKKKKLHLEQGLKWSERQRMEQEHRYMPESKLQYIRKLISNLRWKAPENNKVIIFLRTKVACQVLSQYLQNCGMTCQSIHSDISQKDRAKRMRQFRKDPSGILVASDVAARGIDVPDTQFVVNADMPTSIEVYIHRIGRTARGQGMTGEAHSIVSPKDYVLAVPLVRVLQEAGQTVPPQLQEWAEGKNLPKFDPRTNQVLSWLQRNEQRKERYRIKDVGQAFDSSFTPGAEYTEALKKDEKTPQETSSAAVVHNEDSDQRTAKHKKKGLKRKASNVETENTMTKKQKKSKPSLSTGA